jgi:uncharacterized protein (DUF1697 family)
VARYAAFLRGINVTGSRMKADALCQPFTDLGFEDVKSFRASGNVVFTAGRESVAMVEKRIEAEFRERLGLNAVTFIRSKAQMAALAAAQPFPAKAVAASNGKLQVVFLQKKPSAAVCKDVLAMASDDDRLEFGERELFWLPSGGLMESQLDLKALGKIVGDTTHRTKGTVEQVYTKFFSD